MNPLTALPARSRSVLVGTAVAALVLVPVAAPLAASAAPVFEVESTIPITPGTIRPGQALYNPINESRMQAAAIAPIEILTPADGSILDQRFTMTGSGEPNAFITLTEGAIGILDLIEIGPDGTWSATVSARLDPGPHRWTLTQNADGSVAVLNFTIAADPVITPVTITTPADGEAVGVRPTLNGTGTPGALVTVTEGSTVLGTSSVLADGTWAFALATDLAPGGHVLTATQDVDSSTATVSFTVIATVVPDPSASPKPTDGTLSSTGADPAPLLLTGALVTAAGILANVLVARRRQLSE